jgi:hypothetical protein
MPLLAASAIIGGAAQLGQSIYGMVQGAKMMRDAQNVKKPQFEVQREFEQNRAMALNRYNAANPFMAQAAANLNRQTASATIAAQQTAGDSAAALQAITGVAENAQNEQANLMAQATQMKDTQFSDVMRANEALAADKNRVSEMEYQDYLMAQQQKMAGQQNIMNAVGGIGSMAGDIFSLAAQYPDAFKGLGGSKPAADAGLRSQGSGMGKTIGTGGTLFRQMPIGFNKKFKK